MNNSIKEILIKDFKEILVKEFCTDWKEKRLYIELLVNSTPFSNLLNYITNLQKENQSLKNQLDFIDEQNKHINKLEKMIKDYKSRNEKAVELIRKALVESDIRGNGTLNLSNLLNILKGGDE